MSWSVETLNEAVDAELDGLPEVVVVRVFAKKTEKTPARELEIAKQRVKEIQE